MIKVVKQTRFCSTTYGMFSTFSTNGFGCFALEPPWADNQHNVSCVPMGAYIIRRDTFRSQYPNFKLVDVPGRTAIEIHRGNSLKDTDGCMLLGESYVIDYDQGVYRVNRSEKAMNGFMAAMAGIDEALLIITAAEA